MGYPRVAQALFGVGALGAARASLLGPRSMRIRSIAFSQDKAAELVRFIRRFR